MSAPLFTPEEVAAAIEQGQVQVLANRMEQGFAQVAQALRDIETAHRAEMQRVQTEVAELRARLQAGHATGSSAGDTRLPRMSLQDFPMFTGEQDLRQWTLATRSKARFFGLSEEQTVEVALQRLAGRAQVWSHSFQQNGGVLTGWQDLCDRLRRACAASTSLEGATHKALLTCKHETTVEAYVEQFQLAQMGLGAEAPCDSFLLEMFLLNLKPKLRDYVDLVTPKTLEAAVDRALRYGEKAENKVDNRVSFKDAILQDPVPMQLGAMPKTRSPVRQGGRRDSSPRSPTRRPSPFKTNQDNSPRTWYCGLCRKPHVAGQHCPQFESMLKKVAGSGNAKV